MISRNQMFEPMLVACPSFIPTWDQFCADWKDEPGDLPLYVALCSLASHLVEGMRAGTTQEFAAVFHVVERWHCEGDDYVRESATIGLLEGVQNIAGNSGVDPALFERWLLPESHRWWLKLNRFWDGDATALREE